MNIKCNLEQIMMRESINITSIPDSEESTPRDEHKAIRNQVKKKRQRTSKIPRLEEIVNIECNRVATEVRKIAK
jgi:hypothetical protein